MVENSQKMWNKVLEAIKLEISYQNYRVWFAHLKPEFISDELLVLNCPSSFVKDTLAKKHLSLLQQTVNLVWGRNIQINFQVDPSLAFKKTIEEEAVEFILQTDQTVSSSIVYGLNPKYTMQNFVVGLSNNLAYAAAQAVIQNPGLSYNPLFVYGGTGVGKTHLMQAIGNALFAKNSSSKILYCSSERFMNDFIESIQTKRTAEFRSKYRSTDLLLIDDIQFISGRDSTQEEFFHTFNELQAKNSQVILTADRPPNEIQKLEPRLASRFQGGLMVDIQLPDFDTRVAILKAKFQQRGEANISEECLTIIAEAMPTNARELEGKLIQILQNTKLKGELLTAEAVRSYLGQTTFPTNQKLDPKKVLSSINQFFNIKMADLTGPRRKKELVIPRQIVMYLLYKECGLPYEKIGGLLGGRDHTTIMHGVEKIEQAYSRDREIQRILIEVKQSISTIN